MKIFIDAGHNDSGWNTGAVGNGLKEQDITFIVAKKLGELLVKKGLDIKLSRPTKETNLGTDNGSSINARYTLANNWGADYFISIHCNAGGGTGVETLYNKNDSIDYARIINSTYVSEMGMRDRGIKYRNDIGVIMYAKMPTILIELGFIDTVSDSDILRNKQDNMANAIAKGFYKLLGIVEEENEEEEDMKRYNTVAELPEWAKESIQKLIDKGYLNGDGSGLNLSEDMVRMFVVNDKAGVYK